MFLRLYLEQPFPAKEKEMKLVLGYDVQNEAKSLGKYTMGTDIGHLLMSKTLNYSF